jgi:hypothetical protein
LHSVKKGVGYMLKVGIIIALLVASVSAQQRLPNLQLDLNGTQVFTDDKLIGDPRGFGFTLSKRIADKAMLKLEFDRFTKQAAVRERLYVGFPEQTMIYEWYDEDRELWSVELALLRTVSCARYTFFNLGGGIVFAGFDEDWQLSGGGEKYDIGTRHYFGFVLEMDVLILTSDGFPASCRFGFTHKFMGKQGLQTTVYDSGYGPYLGSSKPEKLTTTEFSLSIGWVIAR